MVKKSIGSETKGSLEDDVDALFQLPLAEFIGARNELAARLKRDGRADDSSLVKALAKPSVSAWAVNQLYWKHREAFDRLMATSQRFQRAQTSNMAGRGADLRESLDARRQAFSNLTDLASDLLSDAGHNPSPDTIRRITTTLEGVSAYAMSTDGPTPGRLTQDVDPPGFESLASLISSIDTTKRNVGETTVTASQKHRSAATQKLGSAATQTPGSVAAQKPDIAATKTRQEESRAAELSKTREAQELRRARIAAAKGSLQEAKRALTETRAGVQRSEAAQKKALAEAKEADAETGQAEKQLRQAEEIFKKAEERFKKASAASQDAADRAHRTATEAREAAQGLEDAKRSLEQASKELESLIRESGAK
jgi:hypothetical protein